MLSSVSSLTEGGSSNPFQHLEKSAVLQEASVICSLRSSVENVHSQCDQNAGTFKVLVYRTLGEKSVRGKTGNSLC